MTTIPKIAIYNGNGLTFVQPPACLPGTCTAVNLSDNNATGTLSVVATKIAFGAGAAAGLGKANGDLQYGGAVPNSCITTQPLAVVPTALVATPPANNSPLQAVLSCATINNGTAAAPAYVPPLPAVFWEPDNVRGRALASFDAQVAPFGSNVSGVITPLDYIVGTEITDNFGQGIKPQPVSGIAGQAATSVTVTVTAFNILAAGQTCSAATPCTMNVSLADSLRLTLGQVSATPNGVAAGQPGAGTPTITAINTATGVITLSAQALPAATVVPTLAVFGTSFGATPVPPTAGIATRYYIQPIAFSCPGTNALWHHFGRHLLRCGRQRRPIPGGRSAVVRIAEQPTSPPLPR